MSFEQFLLRLGVAVIAGALIGLEREIKNKDAGMRTHALVSLGAAAYIVVSLALLEKNGTAGDATRVAGQVATGIGFLGAGVILKNNGSVYGLTTAATIWCCSAIGTLAGSGLIIESFIGVAFVLFITWVMHYAERFFRKELKD
ncbi:MAG: MgtC/SapB family protein [Saprospiraceae bacterium]